MSSPEEPRRQLRLSLADLEVAMDERSWEVDWYLNLETGGVVSVDAETRQELEAIYAETEDAEDGDANDFASVLEQRDLPPWRREALIDADLVEREYGVRFIPVPRSDPSEGYQDLEDFISTVEDGRLRDRLSRAIQGRGPFGRFGSLLAGSPRERKRWFEFRDHRMRERLIEWLESEEIEVILDPGVEREPSASDPPHRSTSGPR